MVGATRNSASHLQICGYFGYGLYCWCGHDCEMGCCSSIENGRSQIAEQKGAIKWENGEMRQDRYYCNYKHCEMKPGAPCPFAKEQPEMLAPSIIESLMSEEWNNAK